MIDQLTTDQSDKRDKKKNRETDQWRDILTSRFGRIVTFILMVSIAGGFKWHVLDFPLTGALPSHVHCSLPTKLKWCGARLSGLQHIQWTTTLMTVVCGVYILQLNLSLRLSININEVTAAEKRMKRKETEVRSVREKKNLLDVLWEVWS